MAKGEIAIELPKLNIRTVEITLIGDSPLISHAWSKKAKEEMLAKQMKKAKAGKEAKDPEKDFQESLYHLEGGGYGFPAVAFKAAAVTACTSISSITKVSARQAFHVEGDMVRIHGSEPKKREDMVRIGMGTADIRYRGEFWPWWVVVEIRHNANVLSAEQITNMMNTAGFGVGVGEWRPERDGQFGCFHVATAEDMKAVIQEAAE